MDKVDMILLMSVNPGFGGQSFIRSSLDKLREARKMIDASGRPIRLEIDGGVKVDNIREIAEAGADTFVAGSAIFSAAKKEDPQHYNTVLKALREANIEIPFNQVDVNMRDLDAVKRYLAQYLQERGKPSKDAQPNAAGAAGNGKRVAGE